MIFSLKQATQLFTTFTVTCSDSPSTRLLVWLQPWTDTILQRRDQQRWDQESCHSRGAQPHDPWDQLHDPPWLPMAKVLQELLSSGSDRLLNTNYQSPQPPVQMLQHPNSSQGTPLLPTLLSCSDSLFLSFRQHLLCCDCWELLPQDKLFLPGSVPP